MNTLYRVVGNAKIAENIFAIVFDAPAIAGRAVPGQFVHIDCGKELRRPISICDIDGSFVKIVFEVKGSGTKWLSERRLGYLLDVLGPLGNGFPEVSGGRILLVGGGIGSAPLLNAAVRYGARCDAALGFADASKAILAEEFAAVCGNVQIATVDGSAGHKGFITDLIEGGYAAIFACGPRPMLKAVVRRANELAIRVYVSMEERMACGIGACLVCACAVEGGSYKRVCRDGPVFAGGEIKW